MGKKSKEIKDIKDLFPSGKYRIARKLHQCDYWKGKSEGGFCKNMILKGEKYFDSGELSQNASSPWATDRFCMDCVEDIETNQLIEKYAEPT